MNTYLNPKSYFVPTIMSLGELQNLTDSAEESPKVTNQILIKSMLHDQISSKKIIFSLIGHYI